MTSQLVELTRDSRNVATLTLNRGQSFNALSEALIEEMAHTFKLLSDDPTLRAVVIAGAGRAFCAGHDLREMRAKPSYEYYEKLFKRCGEMMLSIVRLPVPVIARVHGIATAAGCQLVATCDLAVASSDARFAVSGINAGLFCSTPGVALSRNLGRKAAFEMLVTGEFIDAQTARERGLINRVAASADPQDLDAELEALLKSILSKPGQSLAIGKALFYRQLELGFSAALDDAARTMAHNMMEPCALEGVQAFIEKRAPNWSVSST
jgi:enoyl-CoA hydratase/carnithine racemase